MESRIVVAGVLTILIGSFIFFWGFRSANWTFWVLGGLIVILGFFVTLGGIAYTPLEEL
jgi:1,4-dihydroxy-2-naphthoate octaprenyltransferase